MVKWEAWAWKLMLTSEAVAICLKTSELAICLELLYMK